MSEKPQETRVDEPGDLLEQIISHGLEKMSVPAQAASSEDTPKPESGEEALSHPDGKTKRSAVYLYLLVMFGAAFLMLLLAYFVQRRSSEDTISDLRDTMNLSRAELLAEIKALEEQNTALEEHNTALRGELSAAYVDLAQWQKRYEEQVQDANNFYEQYEAAQARLYGWGFIWTLEQYYQMKDYVTCARLLLMRVAAEEPYPIPDAALWRYDEIVPAVIDAGILREDYYLHLDDYSELLEGDIAFNFDFKYSQTDVSRETER